MLTMTGRRRKNAALSLRLRPEMKKALALAAKSECRSQTSLIEWLLMKHCESAGIRITELVDPITRNATNGRKS